MKKLLVFAHVPPPHHGQSYMVQLLLEGFVQRGVELIHVDARVSDGLDDVGSVRAGKLTRLLGYCRQAIRARFSGGAEVFYYVPAPGKRAALYRDWIVMALCRPFFPKLVLHWHALGVSSWLEREGWWFERVISRCLLGRPQLSVVLSASGRGDADWLRSERVEIVHNGIPDPCPDFDQSLMPERQRRLQARLRKQRGEEVAAADEEPFRLLFLAHCIREKGLFDALEGVAIYNARQPVIPARLKIAGSFMSERERTELMEAIRGRGLEEMVEYVGFAGEEEKRRLLTEADALCFPTYYPAENLPVVVIEAMAFGCLPLVTRWRGIPELLPPDYRAYVREQAPEEVADVIGEMLTLDLAVRMRAEFETRFTLERHLERLREVLADELGEDPRKDADRRQDG